MWSPLPHPPTGALACTPGLCPDGIEPVTLRVTGRPSVHFTTGLLLQTKPVPGLTLTCLSWEEHRAQKSPSSLPGLTARHHPHPHSLPRVPFTTVCVSPACRPPGSRHSVLLSGVPAEAGGRRVGRHSLHQHLWCEGRGKRVHCLMRTCALHVPARVLGGWHSWSISYRGAGWDSGGPPLSPFLWASQPTPSVHSWDLSALCF